MISIFFPNKNTRSGKLIDLALSCSPKPLLASNGCTNETEKRKLQTNLDHSQSEILLFMSLSYFKSMVIFPLASGLS